MFNAEVRFTFYVLCSLSYLHCKERGLWNDSEPHPFQILDLKGTLQIVLDSCAEFRCTLYFYTHPLCYIPGREANETIALPVLTFLIRKRLNVLYATRAELRYTLSLRYIERGQ